MEKQWNQWVNSTFSNVTWTHIAIAVASFATSWLLLWGLYHLAQKRLSRWLDHFHTRFSTLLQAMLKAIRPAFFPIYASAIGLSTLTLQPTVHRTIAFVVGFFLLYQIMLIINCIIDDLFYRFGAQEINGRMTPNAKSNLIAGTKVAAWLIAMLIMLDNFGINVSTFVAGLGIGGIAVALAAQAILGDTFGSFTITLDKPFVPGDYISFGADEGQVETIGLKTTRIRGLGGEIIVVPNSELTRSRLKNYAHMQERRGVIRQLISDTTSISLLEKLPDLIKEVFTRINGLRVSRIHLTGTEPQAFVIEIEWFSQGPNYVEFLDRQQAAYLALYKTLREAKIYRPTPEKLVITPEALQHSLELH